jgi:hypothetical protein
VERFYPTALMTVSVIPPGCSGLTSTGTSARGSTGEEGPTVDADSNRPVFGSCWLGLLSTTNPTPLRESAPGHCGPLLILWPVPHLRFLVAVDRHQTH